MKDSEPIGLPITIQIDKPFDTTNTPLATALMTMGVKPHPEMDVATNHYDEQHPAGSKRDERGVPLVPGKVWYHLQNKSDGGVDTNKLADAFAARVADQDLDVIVAKLQAYAQKHGGDIQRMIDELVATLPLAIMCYMRGFSDNRKSVMEYWKHAVPLAVVRTGENSYSVVSLRASDQTKAEVLR